jgi:hypothetical protein
VLLMGRRLEQPQYQAQIAQNFQNPIIIPPLRLPASAWLVNFLFGRKNGAGQPDGFRRKFESGIAPMV